MRHEFHAARLRAALSVLFMLAMIAGTVAFARIWNASAVAYVLVAGICILYALITLSNFRLVTHRGPVVIIDSQGVFDSRVMARPVPWSAITLIGHDRTRFGGLVRLYVDDPDRYERPGPRWWRRIRRRATYDNDFGIVRAGLKARLSDLLIAMASTENLAGLNALANYVYRSDKPVPGAPEPALLLQRIRRAARKAEDRLALAWALLDGSIPPDQAAAQQLIDAEIAANADKVRDFAVSVQNSALVVDTPFLDAVYKRLVAAGHATGELLETSPEELQRSEDRVLHGPPAPSPGKRIWAGTKMVFWIIIGIFFISMTISAFVDIRSDCDDATWRVVSGRITEARVVARDGLKAMSFSFEDVSVRFVVAADHPQHDSVIGVPWPGVFTSVIVREPDFAEATRKVRDYVARNGKEPRNNRLFWLSKDPEVPIFAMRRGTTPLIDLEVSCKAQAQGWPRRLSIALIFLAMFAVVPFLVRREARVMLGRRSRL